MIKIYSSAEPSKISMGSLMKGLVLDMPLNSKRYNAGTGKFDDLTPYENRGINHGAAVGSLYSTFVKADSDYVDCSNDASINNLSTYSVATWFRTASLPTAGNYPRMVTQQDASGWIWFLYLHGDNSGQISFVHKYSTTNATACMDIPTIGQWYHAIGAIDEADGIPRIFINGIEPSYMSQITGVGTMQHDTNIHIGIGNKVGGGKEWDGDLAKVRIYNRVPTPAEALLLFEKQKGMFL